MQSRCFTASLEQLHPMMEWISTRAKQAGLDGAPLRQLELACEEAIVNVIHHAYQGADKQLEIRYSRVDQGVEITLIDEGSFFNPLQMDEPSLELSLEEREPGGLGIFLLKHYVDEVRYCHEQGRNVLVLFKKLIAHH